MQPRLDEGPSAVTAEFTGAGLFQTRVAVRGGSVLADEPLEVGGLGSGPTPYELLSAALAACTVMTLRLYAQRKGWELPPFQVEVAHSAPGDGQPRDRFSRVIVIPEEVDPERRDKLLEIAGKCPVHRTLMRGFEISSSVASREAFIGEPASQHMHDMAVACED